MKNEIDGLLQQAPLVALVQAEDADTAIRASQALATGGKSIIEVLFRSDAAFDCLGAVAREAPEAVAGAGRCYRPRRPKQRSTRERASSFRRGSTRAWSARPSPRGRRPIPASERRPNCNVRAISAWIP